MQHNSREREILNCWQTNAQPWTHTVRQRQIESRRLATDHAIIQAVRHQHPRTVLDLGCGEGWLTRALTALGIKTLGIDAIPALIDQAKALGNGAFSVMDYQAIAMGELKVRVDAVVCNFSLFGNESVTHLFPAVASLLNPNGCLIIQTLHPAIACGEMPYEDGWRKGSWEGFSHEFTRPAPWYFRTVENWQQLFQRNGFQNLQVTEPLHPQSQEPMSIIFTATSRNV